MEQKKVDSSALDVLVWDGPYKKVLSSEDLLDAPLVYALRNINNLVQKTKGIL